MTDIAMKQEVNNGHHQMPRFVLNFFNVLILAGLLWASIHLLQWAYNTKLAHTLVIGTSNITAEFREHQLGCLAKNIYHEAGSEPFEGKVAVAQVTMNRVNSGQFPEDVCKTIYQKNIVYDKVICQFSWLCDRALEFRPINKINYNESMIAAQKVLLENYKLPGLEKALFFHGDYISPSGWERHKKVAHIGHHIFYE
jgi:spore germination cell wall hydrolase CwlJ-like protein